MQGTQKTVGDYVTQPAITINGDSSLLDAIALMRKQGISSLLVEENTALVGIFTERDLLNKVEFTCSDGLNSIKVKDLMGRHLKTADYSESYINVIDMMQKFGIRHMPIKRNGEIIGIVSLRDLLGHYHENLEHVLETTVTALSSAVEKRDPYTAGHQERVTQLACAIARELNLDEKNISGLRMASIIHDIGKMYVPSEILNKPGRLSDAELTLIKIHPQVGYDILKHVEFPWPIADIVLQHHERLDGSGYPRGLTGDNIIFEAKIIGVADVVEAMASHRPYRPSLGRDKALSEVSEKKGVHYDPNIVDACLLLFHKGFMFANKTY